MAKKKARLLTFLSGFVQPPNTGRIVAQVDSLNQAGTAHSMLLKWLGTEAGWGSYNIHWTATRICVVEEMQSTTFAMGPDGTVVVGAISGTTEEQIDTSNKGPSRRGDLRDLRQIGMGLYAAGISRQVYRRSGPNAWVRCDAGVVLPVGKIDVAGFNSIDGLTENDIYAVGFKGEIWRCVKGKWSQIDSPTDMILHRVRVVRPDLAFAAGQAGVLLRATGEQWLPIIQDVTTEDFWGMEWFQDALYLACDDGLFRLTKKDKLQRVNMKLEPGWTFRHLHATSEVLWSFGPKHIAWTRDGVQWVDQTPG